VNEPINPSEISSTQSEGGMIQGFFIRGEMPRVVQLSTKVVMGIAVLGGLAIAGAFYWGMQQRKAAEAQQQELIGAEQKARAEGINMLPKDYAGMPRETPRLGPALPGDLGRPMLHAGVLPGATIGSAAPVDPEVQRQNQEIEAARVSRLFATANIRQASGAGATAIPAVATAAGNTAQSALFANDETFAQSGQDRKIASVNATGDSKAVSNNRLRSAASPDRACL